MIRCSEIRHAWSCPTHSTGSGCDGSRHNRLRPRCLVYRALLESRRTTSTWCATAARPMKDKVVIERALSLRREPGGQVGSLRAGGGALQEDQRGREEPH